MILTKTAQVFIKCDGKSCGSLTRCLLMTSPDSDQVFYIDTEDIAKQLKEDHHWIATMHGHYCCDQCFENMLKEKMNMTDGVL